MAHMLYWRCWFHIRTYIFSNSDPVINFLTNLGRKSKKCPFCLKIGTHCTSRMLIFIPNLVFRISNPNPLLGKFKSKKVNCFLCLEAYAKSILWMWLQVRKDWKQRQYWIIVLSACGSYIFLAAKCKNWSNQRKNVT